MEIRNRKSINDSLKKYDYLSNNHNDFIEITEWVNEEGFDISINKESDYKLISLTRGELDAINYLVQSLGYKES